MRHGASLEQAAHALSKHIYESAQSTAGPGFTSESGPGDGGGSSDDVIDAEYETKKE